MKMLRYMYCLRLACAHAEKDGKSIQAHLAPVHVVGALRKAIAPQLERLWDMVHTGTGYINEQEYMKINCLMQKALDPATTQEEAQDGAKADWRRDVRRTKANMWFRQEEQLDKAGFLASMLELCGCFSDGHNEEEYQKFLDNLLEKIRDLEKKPKENGWWLRLTKPVTTLQGAVAAATKREKNLGPEYARHSQESKSSFGSKCQTPPTARPRRNGAYESMGLCLTKSKPSLEAPPHHAAAAYSEPVLLFRTQSNPVSLSTLPALATPRSQSKWTALNQNYEQPRPKSPQGQAGFTDGFGHMLDRLSMRHAATEKMLTEQHATIEQRRLHPCRSPEDRSHGSPRPPPFASSSFNCRPPLTSGSYTERRSPVPPPRPNRPLLHQHIPQRRQPHQLEEALCVASSSCRVFKKVQRAICLTSRG